MELWTMKIALVLAVFLSVATSAPPDLKQPGTPANQPGTPANQPGTPVNQPGTPVNKPGTPVNQPGTPGNQPGTPVKQPGTPTDKPADGMYLLYGIKYAICSLAHSAFLPLQKYHVEKLI